MKARLRQLLAQLLVVAMSLSLLSANVWAADLSEEVPDPETAAQSELASDDASAEEAEAEEPVTEEAEAEEPVTVEAKAEEPEAEEPVTEETVTEEAKADEPVMEEAKASYNIPASGNTDVDLSNLQAGEFILVYDDDGGPDGSYSNGSDGTLTLTPPEGKALRITGSVKTEGGWDFFYLYGGNTDNELLKLSGFGQSVDVSTAKRPVIFRLTSDNGGQFSGVALTVTVIDCLTVTYASNGGTGSMPVGAALEDEAFTFPDCGFTPPAGKIFSGWLSSGDGSIYQAGDSVTLTANGTFTAQWSDPVTVTFDSNGGSDVAAQNVLLNGRATAPTPTRDGYRFLYWTKDGSEFDFATPITEDITLLALWAPGGTAVVNDGTATDNYVPVFGYYVDTGSKSQFILPKEQLTSMKNRSIQQMTFYYSSFEGNTPNGWVGAEFEVYMAEVDYTTFSSTSFVDWNSMTKVRNAAALTGSDGNKMEVSLDTPYEYNDGNLLIGILQTKIGQYKDIHFYGISAAGASLGGFGSLSSNIKQRDFLPKISFEYGLPHQHNWTCTADGATITAVCDGVAEGICLEPAETLTITAPEDLTANGEARAAALTISDNSQCFTGSYPIVYRQGETELSGPPTEAGTYTASVTVEGATAEVEFTLVATVPQHLTLEASTADVDSAASVGDLTIDPDGELYGGDQVTLTAPAVAGYNFLGWFNGDEKVCETLVYRFTITANTALVAKYKARGNATVTISTVNGGKYTVGNNATVKSGGTETVQLGSDLTITAQDAEQVLQWQNETGKVMGTGESLTVPVTGNMTIILVYKTVEEAQSFVQFITDYNQVLSYNQYSSASEITFPTPPSKLGYTFNCWVFEGTNTEATVEAIKARIGQDTLITLKPHYTRDLDDICTVTVNYVDAGGTSLGSEIYYDKAVGSSFTVTAPDKAGYVFSCWKDASGNELGCSSRYNMQIRGDVTLTACYVDEGTAVAAEPVITIGEPYKTVSGSVHKVSCTVTRSVPDGYTLIEQGMLYGRDVANPAPETFFYTDGSNGVSRYKAGDTSPNGYLFGNIKVANDVVVVSFRGYMVVRNDVTGNQEFYFTDIVSASFSQIGA